MGARNYHYVSQFFTRPWESDPIRRLLTFYDFHTKGFQQRHAKRLFASRGLHSFEVEQRLNSLIETPLAGAREQLLALSPDTRVITLDDWPVTRALHLLVFVQTTRVSDALDRTETLRALVHQDIAALDVLAATTARAFTPIGLRIPGSQRLRYPATGFFAFPTIDNVVGCHIGVAVPITEHVAVALVPKTTDIPALEQRINRDALLPAFSVTPVGSRATKVVIHPDELAQVHPEALSAELEEHRNSTRKSIDLVHSIHTEFTRLDELLGITVFRAAIEPLRYGLGQRLAHSTDTVTAK